MNVKILGAGCPNCQKLEKNVVKALDDNGQHYNLDKVTDFQEIAQYGIMSTPALVVDEQVVSYGKVLSASEAWSLLAPMQNK